jgi:hypothetical protein
LQAGRFASIANQKFTRASLSSVLPTKHALNHHFYASVVFRIALRAIDIILDLAKHKLKPVAGKETK